MANVPCPATWQRLERQEGRPADWRNRQHKADDRRPWHMADLNRGDHTSALSFPVLPVGLIASAQSIMTNDDFRSAVGSRPSSAASKEYLSVVARCEIIAMNFLSEFGVAAEVVFRLSSGYDLSLDRGIERLV